MVCNGSVDVSGALSVEGKTKFDADVQFYKKIYDLAGYEIINAASGGNSLVIGYGQYEHGAKTYLEGGDICLRMQQNGNLRIQAGSKDSVETRFVLSKVSWTLSGSTAYRDTIESKGGFVLSANDGNNVLYLVGKSVYLGSNSKINGSLTTTGDVKSGGDIFLNFASTSGTIPLVVNTKGVITVASSSERYKENIKPVEDAVLDPSGLYDVQVCQYNYKPEYKDNELVSGTQIGVIAEDLDKHYPNAVIYDSEGRPESWQDRIMIPAMLKLIQEQKQQLDDLRAEVDALKAKL